MNKTSKKACVKNQSVSAESANHSNKQGAVIHLTKPPFLKTPSYIAVILASCVFGAEYAQAACGTLASGVYNSLVSCTSSSGDATITTQPNTTVIIPDSGRLSGDNGIRVTSLIGAASLNLNDTSVISNDNAFGIVSSAQNTTGNSSIKLTGDNTITMNSAKALSAVWAQSGVNGLAGTASIDVTGTLNITNHGLNYDTLAAGLATVDNAFGAGSSSNMSIQHQGSGTISTLSSPAIYARSNAEHADIDIDVGSNVILDVTRSSIYDGGQNAAAIGVKAGTATGLTTVDNAGTILLRGNGNGINLQTAGDMEIRNTGTISGINPTAGQGYFTGIMADASYQSANVRNVTINNSGAITATGIPRDFFAIQANVYNGSIDIINRGDINAAGNATGIKAQVIDYDSTGNITIASDASINLDSYGSAISLINNGLGNITVTGNGDINTWGSAIAATAYNGGNVTVDYSGDLSVANAGIMIGAWQGDAKIHYTGDSLLMNGMYGGTGLVASGQNVLIENTAAIVGTGYNLTGILATTSRPDDLAANLIIHNQGNITLSQDDGAGIKASPSGAAHIDVVNSGDISTSGNYSLGLSVATAQISDGNVTNSGNITTLGQQSNAINIELRGDYQLNTPRHLETNNSGIISTSGDQSSGINVVSYGANPWSMPPTMSPPTDIIINNQGAISTIGAQSHGISAAVIDSGTDNHFGNIIIDNRADISTHGNAKAADPVNYIPDLSAADGIHAESVLGAITINHHTATITADAVDAAGIRALSTDGGAIIIGNDAGQIHGGSHDGAGVLIGGLSQTLNNTGIIDALSDHAVVFDGNDVIGSVTLNNEVGGQLTGLVSSKDSTVTMNNAGTWTQRNFADTDGDFVRDTLSVAVSDFGNSSNNQINNSGTLTLAGDEDAATTLNNAGEYSTGYTANTMALGGATQGQILGVNTFTNSGIIDLSSNNTVGDVLIVSGSHSRHSRWWGLCGQWRTTQNQYGFE